LAELREKKKKKREGRGAEGGLGAITRANSYIQLYNQRG